MTRLRPATAGATVGKQCNTSLYAGISLYLLRRKVRSGDNQQETRKRILRDYTRRVRVKLDDDIVRSLWRHRGDEIASR